VRLLEIGSKGIGKPVGDVLYQTTPEWKECPSGARPWPTEKRNDSRSLRDDRRKGKSNGKTRATARTTADPCGMTTKRHSGSLRDDNKKTTATKRHSRSPSGMTTKRQQQIPAG
jgi:hypothetical protein